MATHDRWQRLEEILYELLGLPARERAARLDELVTGDPELRAQVEAFLAEDARAGGPLDGGVERIARGALAGAGDPARGEDGTPGAAPVAAAANDGEAPGDHHQPGGGAVAGRRIGPYRVLRELGRGGMGEVLLAERADGEFEQRVALKLVRGGLGGRDAAAGTAIVERFRHERQILARLRHPHIAAFLDGGTTEGGLVYLAMEYVEGERITDYCDRNRLGIDARLELVEQACAAVAHAHRNLVVHRDLKPDNVLVAAGGTVKLLDFGIAKVLDPEITGQPIAAQTTHPFLTPSHAAPEQLRGEAISTATDVYALGVLLYELLTGSHPHGDSTGSIAMVRAVLEEDPPAPSAVIWKSRPDGGAGEPGSGEAIARCRGLEPPALRRRLRGDLDNIVERALRKEPGDRYGSAEELRADLERHRRSLPVTARPATVRYRLRKLVRRHRVVSAAVLAVLAALLLGAAGVAWQAGVASRERDRAQLEARRAGAVKDYLIEVFSAADPTFESGASLTALELVDRGASRLARRFADDPAVRAEITTVLGTVLTSLAQFERSDSLLAGARGVYHRLGEPEQEASVLTSMAANALWQGRLEVGEARLDEALDLLRDAGLEGQAMSHVLGALGDAYLQEGRHAEAEQVMRDGLRIARTAIGDEHEDTAAMQQGLAVVLDELGQLDEAERHMRRSLEILERVEPDGGLATARALSSLGELLEDRGELEESERVGRQAVAILRREYGAAGHPGLAIALSNLAGTVRERGGLEEAEQLQLEAADLVRSHLGENHYFLARILNNLSVTRTRMGDIEGAGELIDESIRIMQHHLGTRHPALLAPYCNRADNLLVRGRAAEAEQQAREALEMARALRGEHHPEVAYPLLSLAHACQELGKRDEAARYLREAHAIRLEALGPEHELTRAVMEEIEALGSAAADRPGR
ncbi:MAG: tetratricopeptide repeat protein [Candidatus Eiseniibacteriota bacterium]|jgi:serine/threonine-protein kinase